MVVFIRYLVFIMMNKFFFSILFLSSLFTKAQFIENKKEIQDTAFTIPMITVSYAFQWSGSEMADRFGNNNNIGVRFYI